MPDSSYPDSAVADIEVAAHTLLLPQGTYCIYVTEVAAGLEPALLPGLSVAIAPGEEGSAIDVARLEGEAWLRRPGDAMLVRVHAARVRLLLTSYNLAHAVGATPPKIQVQRLDTPAALPVLQQQVAAVAAAEQQVLVHVRKHGDLTGGFGEWVGEQADDTWIEGFAITPPVGLAAADFEYQAVLGKGWFSPWIQGGDFCGSRGMQLPILGFRVNLKGRAAEDFACSYSAIFADGFEVGPIMAGMLCALSELKAATKLRVSIMPKTAVPVTAVANLALPEVPPAKAPRAQRGAMKRSVRGQG